MARNDWVAYIKGNAGRFGLDPHAVLAIASHEGLSGNVGDGGHAFGPFQLNDAGGVLTNRPGDHRAFAESKQGMDWAMAKMAEAGARGKTGMAAIKAIATNFERPADIPAEIADAAAHYGKVGTGVAAGRVGKATFQQPDGTLDAQGISGMFGGSYPRAALMQMLLAPSKKFDSSDPSSGTSDAILPMLVAMRQAAKGTSTTGMPQGLGSPSPTTLAEPRGVLAELLHEHVGGPTHSTGEHIHIALTNPKAMLDAIAQAQRMGLSVRENPYTDTVDPVHAEHSYHKRDFAGTYGGKKLGMASDVSGDAAAMKAYQQWAQRTFR